MMATKLVEKKCYICSSDKFVDDHHLDCREGKDSPETEPLCRRCHRTYHDLGVHWFDDEYLDKAIEIENRKREIQYSRLKAPIRPLELLTRDKIRRPTYWNKKHGIKPEKPKSDRNPAFPFHLPHGEPLCGWPWVQNHMYDLINWVPRIEIKTPSLSLGEDIDSEKKLKDTIKIIRGLK